jgi:hypothetical protein
MPRYLKDILWTTGDTAILKKRGIFTRGVKVHHLGLSSVKNQMYVFGVHSQPTQHSLKSMVLISQQVRSSAYDMCETCTPPASRMCTSSRITVLQDILTTAVLS